MTSLQNAIKDVLPEGADKWCQEHDTRRLSSWEVECLNALRDVKTNKLTLHKNFVLVTPSSSAKTLIGEMLLLAHLTENRKRMELRIASEGCKEADVWLESKVRICLFISPYVMNIKEKKKYFSQFFSPHISLQEFSQKSKFSVRKAAESIFSAGFSSSSSRFDIALCTIEKAHTLVLLLAEKGVLCELISLIMIDQVDLIFEDSEGRGAVLKNLIGLVRALSGKEETPLQVVTFFNTFNDLENFGKWLDAVTFRADPKFTYCKEFLLCENKMFQLLHCHHKRLPLDTCRVCRKKDDDVYDYASSCCSCCIFETLSGHSFCNTESIGENVTSGFTKQDRHFARVVLRNYLDNRSILIFCPSKYSAERTAFNLMSLFSAVLCHHQCTPSQLQLFHKVRQTHNPYVSSLTIKETAELILWRIAYYHSGLPVEERQLLAKGFDCGSLSVLCTTSTIALSGNHCADFVFIKSPYSGKKFLDATRYNQMLRCVKPTKFGALYLCCTAKDELRCQHMMQAIILRLHQAAPSCAQQLSTSFLRFLLDYIVCATGHLDNKNISSSNALGLPTYLLEKCYEFYYHHPSQRVEEENKETSLNAVQEGLYILVKMNQVIFTTKQRTHLLPTLQGRAIAFSGLDPENGYLVYVEADRLSNPLILDSELHLTYLCCPPNPNFNINWKVLRQLVGNLQRSDKLVLEYLDIDLSLIQYCALQDNSSHVNEIKDNYQLGRYTRLYVSLLCLAMIRTCPIESIMRTFSVSRGDIENVKNSVLSFGRKVKNLVHRLQWWCLDTVLDKFFSLLTFGSSTEYLNLMQVPHTTLRLAKALYVSGLSTAEAVANASLSKIEKCYKKQNVLSGHKGNIGRLLAIRTSCSAKAYVKKRRQSVGSRQDESNQILNTYPQDNSSEGSFHFEDLDEDNQPAVKNLIRAPSPNITQKKLTPMKENLSVHSLEMYSHSPPIVSRTVNEADFSEADLSEASFDLYACHEHRQVMQKDQNTPRRSKENDFQNKKENLAMESLRIYSQVPHLFQSNPDETDFSDAEIFSWDEKDDEEHQSLDTNPVNVEKSAALSIHETELQCQDHLNFDISLSSDQDGESSVFHSEKKQTKQESRMNVTDRSLEDPEQHTAHHTLLDLKSSKDREDQCSMIDSCYIMDNTLFKPLQNVNSFFNKKPKTISIVNETFVSVIYASSSPSLSHHQEVESLSNSWRNYSSCLETHSLVVFGLALPCEENIRYDSSLIDLLSPLFMTFLFPCGHLYKCLVDSNEHTRSALPPSFVSYLESSSNTLVVQDLYVFLKFFAVRYDIKTIRCLVLDPFSAHQLLKPQELHNWSSLTFSKGIQQLCNVYSIQLSFDTPRPATHKHLCSTMEIKHQESIASKKLSLMWSLLCLGGIMSCTIQNNAGLYDCWRIEQSYLKALATAEATGFTLSQAFLFHNSSTDSQDPIPTLSTFDILQLRLVEIHTQLVELTGRVTDVPPLILSQDPEHLVEDLNENPEKHTMICDILKEYGLLTTLREILKNSETTRVEPRTHFDEEIDEFHDLYHLDDEDMPSPHELLRSSESKETKVYFHFHSIYKPFFHRISLEFCNLVSMGEEIKFHVPTRICVNDILLMAQHGGRINEFVNYYLHKGSRKPTSPHRDEKHNVCWVLITLNGSSSSGNKQPSYRCGKLEEICLKSKETYIVKVLHPIIPLNMLLENISKSSLENPKHYSKSILHSYSPEDVFLIPTSYLIPLCLSIEFNAVPKMSKMISFSLAHLVKAPMHRSYLVLHYEDLLLDIFFLLIRDKGFRQQVDTDKGLEDLIKRYLQMDTFSPQHNQNLNEDFYQVLFTHPNVKYQIESLERQARLSHQLTSPLRNTIFFTSGDEANPNSHHIIAGLCHMCRVDIMKLTVSFVYDLSVRDAQFQSFTVVAVGVDTVFLECNDATPSEVITHLLNLTRDSLRSFFPSSFRLSATLKKYLFSPQCDMLFKPT